MRRLIGRHDTNTLTCLANLGASLIDTDVDEAVTLLTEALDLRREHTPAEVASIDTIRGNLSYALPWGFHQHLLHPNFLNVSGSIAGCLAFTAPARLVYRRTRNLRVLFRPAGSDLTRVLHPGSGCPRGCRSSQR